jgi:hypothetical protein
VKRYFSGFLEANKFICTGTYKEGASRAAMIDARKRAKAACDFAKKQDPTLSYWFHNKPTKAASYVNKVLVTMKDQKN